ncbi:MAG TPA: hypothetical protein VKS81_09010, partial [Bacteroidota bacterium]|nr:hypothetical protein [Bacteroidota bacterium]
KMVRAQGSAAHIIMMTRTSGAGLPPRLKKAGIDDMLNVAEINTPVFGWTFLSTLNYADTKKEAEGYVALQKRYNFLCSALKEITWDAAVAVRSMRSALNSMKSVSLPPAAKKSLLGLNSSVNKLNHEIEDLAELRDRLEKETALFKKLLNARAS